MFTQKTATLIGLYIVSQLIIACQPNPSSPSLPEHERNTSDIFWEKTSLDLGKIKMGDTIRFFFRFENSGKYPLIISEKEKTCGCIQVNTPANPVLPGKRDSIQVVFITRLSITGWQRKSIRITTNTPTPLHNLYFTAEVTGHK